MRAMKQTFGALCAISALWMPSAFAQKMQGHMMVEGPCAQPSLSCASAATPTIANDGSVWLAWAAGGHVSVAHSTDGGAHFGPAIMVDRKPAHLDNGPDSRPSIAIDSAGRIVVTYSIFKDDAYNGQVLVSVSSDKGVSFSPPVPVTDDPASQRFAALATDPSGRLFLSWLDKRGRTAAKKAGHDYIGAGVAFSWWEAATAKFTPARILKDNSCECCRIGLAFAGEGRPVVTFRNIYPGMIRDHAITTFGASGEIGPIYRVSTDNWKIDACPHHGPSLAVSPAGAYHVAWFTQGDARKGLFYARSGDGGRSFSAPMPIGDPARQNSRPRLLVSGGALWLAWKEFDGNRTTIGVMSSRDDGVNWSKPRVVAETADASDQPILVDGGKGPLLSWLTHEEGYRLLPLDAAP